MSATIQILLFLRASEFVLRNLENFRLKLEFVWYKRIMTNVNNYWEKKDSPTPAACYGYYGTISRSIQFKSPENFS